MNVGFKTQSDLQFTLKIDAKYDGCIELTPTIEITSFAYESHQAYFNVVDITTSIKLPGLYRANIFLGDVCIGQVELVLAPAFAVNGGRKKESECAEGNWKEPEYPVPIPCTPPQCGTCIETSCNISGCDNQVDHSGYGSNVFVRKGYGS